MRKFSEHQGVVFFFFFRFSLPQTYDKRFGSILNQYFVFGGEFSSFYEKYFKKGTFRHKFSGFRKTIVATIAYNMKG